MRITAELQEASVSAFERFLRGLLSAIGVRGTLFIVLRWIGKLGLKEPCTEL